MVKVTELETQNKTLVENKIKAEADQAKSLADLAKIQEEIAAKDARIKELNEQSNTPASSEELDKAKAEVLELNKKLEEALQKNLELDQLTRQVIQKLQETETKMEEIVAANELKSPPEVVVLEPAANIGGSSLVDTNYGNEARSEAKLLEMSENVGMKELISTTTQTSKITLSDFKNGKKYSTYSEEFMAFDRMRSIRIILLNDVGGMGFYPDRNTGPKYSEVYKKARKADFDKVYQYCNEYFVDELAKEFLNLTSKDDSKLYQPAQKLSEFTLFGLIPNILSEICTFFINCDNQISLSHQTKLLATLYQLPNRNPEAQ